LAPKAKEELPMDIVMQVMEKVNNVFSKETLEKLAQETGFIKRKRKVEAKKFLENILLLKLESPESSLEDLVYAFNKDNCPISKQALHKKFNNAAVLFIQKVLSLLLDNAFTDSTTCLKSVPFIKNIQVIDSTEIRLNKGLKDLFPQVRNQGAAVKLQSLVNVVNNAILSLEIRPSKEPDQKYKNHLAYLQPNDLLIADLGYFSVNTFSEIEEKKSYFLSRYFKNTHLYNVNTNGLIHLREHLIQAPTETVEFPVHLGQIKFPCRLVAMKLPEEAYQQRLKNIAEKKRKDPRSKVEPNDILNRWTIFVTNLPSCVDVNTLLQLYRFRWQIELFYKMGKTFLKLRKIHDASQQRAMISLYILLIATVLLSFVVINIIDKEISLYKASKIFIKNIREFIGYIGNSKKCAVSWLQDLISKFAIKESRKNRPSTKHLLGANYA
jgi:hypothetical protein